MKLADAIRNFDGKHIEPLEAVASELLTDEGGVDALLVLSHSDDVKTQTAATWILKWLYEQQVTFTKPQTQEVLRLLREVTSWVAKLHLLQILDGLVIPPRNGNGLRKTLDLHVSDENKLLRAWAYNGLFVLGDQISRFREDVAALLSQAEDDPAASVRARVRQIRKASRWVNDCLTNR